jgi:hypothetical protein
MKQESGEMKGRLIGIGVVVVATAATAGRFAITRGGARPGAQPPPKWENGPPATPGYFPIAVWLQDPKNAPRFKAAGINLYVGLWEGPTEAQLAALREAGMQVICSQNPVGLAHRADRTIVGWMHGDEPDNAQPLPGGQGYGPCIPPAKIVADYDRLRAVDPTRPILLNLGQGVANDAWKGRGAGAKLDDYRTYVKGGDIVSFDVYPVAGIDRKDGENFLWYVPKGIDRLRDWSGARRSIWNCLECTHISSDRRATPHQVRAEAWMALIHGSRGLIYFVHQFEPRFIEAALLEDPEMLAAVTALNAQIRSLAPVINSPAIPDGATVRSSAADVPIDLTVRRQGRATYVFAVGMRNAPARGSFEVRGLPGTATAEVLGEGRQVVLRAGRFDDDFKPYDVHLYRIAGE